MENAVRGLEPDVIQSLAVWVMSQWWPAKQPFVLALGLRNTQVNSRTALRNLERLGFPSHDLATQGPLPSQPGASAAGVNLEARRFALALAVDLVKGQGRTAGDAIGVADAFLPWLTG